MTWAETIIGLPFSYYHHFVLEEKYGFNKMTMNTWVTDMIKGQALGLAFGIPIGSAFLAIIRKTGQNFFYYLWVFMLAVQILGMTIYPILIVPLFNKLEPLKPGKLKDSVEALASKLEFPFPNCRSSTAASAARTATLTSPDCRGSARRRLSSSTRCWKRAQIRKWRLFWAMSSVTGR